MKRSPLVTVAVRVNGVKLHFLLDTGAEMTVIHSNAADRIGVVPAGKEFVSGFGGGRIEVEMVIIDHFDFASRTIKGLRAIKDSTAYNDELLFDGVLGLDVLKDYRLVIDFKKRHVIAARY